MNTFHEDDAVESMTFALLIVFGLDPALYLPRDMKPADWATYAMEIVQEIREDGLDIKPPCSPG